MTIRRFAGVMYLIAATMFLISGLTRADRRPFYLIIAAVFYLIGFLRLKSSPPSVPPS